ncbi:MAG TPA: AAA family ATPase [Pirellulales bacterium]
MRISYVEIQGFRKLERIRIDLNDTTTLFVGANNSGKTSAMDALCTFLTETCDFTTNDFTLSNWSQGNAIGAKWLKDDGAKPVSADPDPSWEAVVPTLDVWITVEDGEFHYVRGILPTLDWAGGALGVRLRYEPKDALELKAQYLAAAKLAAETKAAGAKNGNGTAAAVTLWPSDLRSFLDRKLGSLFTIKCYLLDASKMKSPVNGVAQPQALPAGSEAIEGKPLNKLIRINVIGAQRGFGAQGSGDSEDLETARKNGRLSEQLKSYYKNHLDPTDYPEPSDLEALAAIEEAQRQYDLRLKDGFGASMKELEDLNYPGVTDPVLKIGTKLRPVDGLSHNAAVQYHLVGEGADGKTQALTLPEQYNGLGYQNLISMVFRLMAFRDAWMRVGKASKSTTSEQNGHQIPPLHLVLIEEPEAHLHVQVQQVFVRKAYDVLRNHVELKAKTQLCTQLVVSTHSSHIAHECEFSCLRYFRRLPKTATTVPTSAVINLSEVFGSENDTSRFAARYLLSTHCELFFADAAILVEGAAERMLVPHFIKHHFEKVHRSYVTLFEISGSHAHRLRPLIEKLGLVTVAITDLDAVDPANNRKKAPPRKGAGLVTSNPTLKEWHPQKETIDDLLALKAEAKVKAYPDVPLFSVRCAYQTAVQVKFKSGSVEVIARTFEDALVLENYKVFSLMPPGTAADRFNAAIHDAANADDLTEKLFAAVEACDKAAFALDVLFHCDPKALSVPSYIYEGLEWLQKQLDRKQVDLLATAAAAEVK